MIGLYSAAALVGLVIAAGRGNPDVFRVDASAGGWWLLAGPVIGMGAGLGVVVLTRVSTRRFRWARDLHTVFRDMLGPLTGREILILAMASAIGEEVLFRGALLPWMGLWLQTIVFALVHVGRGKVFVPWTISAFVIGLGLSALAVWTGNLGAPIAAHFVINFLNLRHIVNTPMR